MNSLLANLIKNNRQKEVQNLIEEFKKKFSRFILFRNTKA